MNRRFLITYLFVIPTSLIAAAQTETDCDKSISILNAVDNSNLYTLYIGVGNKISIKVQGVSPENIVVRLSRGIIEGNNTFYTARIFSVGEVVLTVYSKENGTEKRLAQKTIQTRVIPHPESEEFKEVIKSLGLKVIVHQ